MLENPIYGEVLELGKQASDPAYCLDLGCCCQCYSFLARRKFAEPDSDCLPRNHCET